MKSLELNSGLDSNADKDKGKQSIDVEANATITTANIQPNDQRSRRKGTRSSNHKWEPDCVGT